MYETYRMLGVEHEADLARDARSWQLAVEARAGRRGPQPLLALSRRRVVAAGGSCTSCPAALSVADGEIGPAGRKR